MGHGQSVSSSRNVSVTSESGFSTNSAIRVKAAKEHKRHGVVTLKMVVSNPTRRANDQIATHTITPKGCILYGSQVFDPLVVQQGETKLQYCLYVCMSVCISHANPSNCVCDISCRCYFSFI